MIEPLAFAFLLATAFPAAAQDPLPRKAALGLRLAPTPQGQGALVEDVIPGLTGETLGLRKGDIVTAAGGQPVAAPFALVAYAGTLRTGDRAELTVIRAGKSLKRSAKATPRPRESWTKAAADYGAVPWRGGHLRDILVTPAANPQAPVVFLIQGFSCASIEPADPAHPYRALGTALLERGIAYYRVEKPGMGDSAGSPACADIDFAAELDAFRAAYRHLVEVRGVSPDRIFLFGHSLGGIQAPLLAAERAPRGVSVWGTVLRNWADYHQAISSFQGFTSGREDPVANVAQGERAREIFRRYYFDRQSPRDIAAARPDLGPLMRELIDWDGADRTLGRHYKFMADLAHLPLAEAWRDTKSEVLVLYGESDYVALTEDDHELIALIANRYRPGSARFAEVPATGHGMDLIGPPDRIRARALAGESDPPALFNPEVADRLAVWIGESMARPPLTR